VSVSEHLVFRPAPFPESFEIKFQLQSKKGSQNWPPFLHFDFPISIF